MSHIFVSDKRTHLLVEVARAETMTSPHRCLRNRGTEYVSEHGIKVLVGWVAVTKWMGGSSMRPSPSARTRQAINRAAVGPRHKAGDA
jgi:hypothetical protein